MEDTQNEAGRYSNINNKFVDEEDFTDTQDLNVSISVGGPGVRLGKAAVMALIVLAVVLFAIDVSLGIYYSQLNHGIPQNSENFKNIIETYRGTIDKRNKVTKLLESDRRQLDVTRWELEHQKRRGREYTVLINAVHKENADLQSQVAMMTVDCGYCLPGWIHVQSTCFYLSESTLSKKSWQEARNNCQRKGADLAIIDNSAKQSSLNMHILDRSDAQASLHSTGYWMGLRDVEEEGTWLWLNGEPLVEKFWHEGEPNNNNNEDCAANYRGANPFSAWNDAPCTHALRWICEMSPLI